MVYGIIDLYYTADDKWVHGYVVRIGKWKFYNFLRSWTHHECRQTGADPQEFLSALAIKYGNENEFRGYVDYLQAKTGATGSEKFLTG